MPEYLAPGVFVEETSFRAKSIQGVGTSTTAFVGPTRKGPLGLASDVITSFGEFERIYGGIADLNFASPIGQMPNYMAHAVKAFFDNGGARLYVARVFTSTQVTNPASANLTANSAAATIASNGGTVGTFQARYPGAGANGTISAYLKRSPASATTLGAAPVGSMAQLTAGDGTISFFVKDGAGIYQPETPAGDGSDVLNTGNPGGPLELLTLNLELMTGGSEAEGAPILLEGLGFDAAHPRYLGNALPVTPASRGELLAAPYAFIADPAATAFSLRDALFGGGDSSVLPVTGGVDGEALRVSDASRNIVSYSEALTALEEIPDISIIAAPGSSVTAEAAAINNELITHCERLRYRVAILDTPQGQSVSEARAVRAAIDSSHAALYYPWVVVPNPSARPSNASIPKEIALPPSGFVAGIYARTDIQRGVWKAPANEVVRGALRFEREVSKGEQEVLNPEGINCLRSFFGRGNRVWGARTVSSDPEWIYLNVRRYFIYLEASIDRSTQWAVFEPNGPALWSNITETISSFLFAEWRSGALLGATPDEAFFVRCDRSTMTQADLDNGRLICEIGVAAIKPAEFVIFRIGQKTADAQG